MKKMLLCYWLTILLLFIGIACIAIGVLRGENAVVLQKAKLVCLECIGIG